MNSQINESRINESKRFLSEKFQYHFGLSEDETKNLLETLIEVTVLQTTIALNSIPVKNILSPKLVSTPSKTGDLLTDISDVNWLQNCVKRLFFLLEQLENIISNADPTTCSIYFDEILQKIADSMACSTKLKDNPSLFFFKNIYFHMLHL